jgi:hypothetical protein
LSQSADPALMIETPAPLAPSPSSPVRHYGAIFSTIARSFADQLVLAGRRCRSDVPRGFDGSGLTNSPAGQLSQPYPRRTGAARHTSTRSATMKAA